jgi:dihydroorotase
MALREGLADGTIDIIATDHAPHPAESKECEWQYAAFGMLGLETALSVVWQTMIDTKLMDQEELEKRMSTNPARIGQYHRQGQPIIKGAPANLTLFAPNKSWKVDRDLVASKSKNTPFHGMHFGGSVVATFFNGRKTWVAK